jgi:hypothetical protein
VSNKIFKTAAMLAAFGLLLPGAIIIMDMPNASADPMTAPTFGNITVDNATIMVDHQVPENKFFGVVDTTAMQFAIKAYINGDMSVAGKSSVFPGPDTTNTAPMAESANATIFWHQYFSLMKHYNVNLVRLGAGDMWGSGIQYDAWTNHHDAYIAFLHNMLKEAESQGIWVVLVMAGSQEYPTFEYGGSGSVFDPSTSAYANMITYERDTMQSLRNDTALGWYDVFNEPDHNLVDANYWHGDKVKFNTWAKAVEKDTANVTSHPRTMGVAALGTLFSWSKADFDLATGKVGFEIPHVHYYGANRDPANFAGPEQWAKEDGKPLFWGELGENSVYPLVRYTFGEDTIWANGGQAITSMVLTGTPGYPNA